MKEIKLIVKCLPALPCVGIGGLFALSAAVGGGELSLMQRLFALALGLSLVYSGVVYTNKIIDEFAAEVEKRIRSWLNDR